MTTFKTRVPAIALVLGVLLTVPIGASRGRRGSLPPPVPPVIVVNPTPTDCFSGAGCLDPAFGTQGKVVQDIGGDSQSIAAMAIQPDGKIVTAGYRWVGAVGNQDASWVIGRFLGDGTIDTSFGAGGLFTMNVIAGHSSEQPLGVAVQPDGKIVVGGSAVNGDGGATSKTVLIRLSSSGSFDPTFGTAGKVVLTVASGAGGCMALQPDGKIVLVRGVGSLDSSVRRFKTNGAVDTAFGSQGSRTVYGMAANAVALQSTGKIVLAGSKPSVNDAMLARLTSTGALDNSFGSSGSTIVRFTDQRDAFLALSIGSDDSIAAGGHANYIPPVATNLAVARFTANGALSTGFGTSGKFVLDLHGFWDSVRAIILRADGGVEFAGWAGVSGQLDVPSHDRNVLVGRLTATGTLDSSFGSGGLTETAFGVPAIGQAAAVGPDGLLTVAGSLMNAAGTGSQYWMLARYFR